MPSPATPSLSKGPGYVNVPTYALYVAEFELCRSKALQCLANACINGSAMMAAIERRHAREWGAEARRCAAFARALFA